MKILLCLLVMTNSSILFAGYKVKSATYHLESYPETGEKLTDNHLGPFGHNGEAAWMDHEKVFEGTLKIVEYDKEKLSYRHIIIPKVRLGLDFEGFVVQFKISHNSQMEILNLDGKLLSSLTKDFTGTYIGLRVVLGGERLRATNEDGITLKDNGTLVGLGVNFSKADVNATFRFSNEDQKISITDRKGKTLKTYESLDQAMEIESVGILAN